MAVVAMVDVLKGGELMWDLLKGSWLFLIVLMGFSVYGGAIIVNKLLWIKKFTLSPKKIFLMLEKLHAGEIKQLYDSLP